MCYLPLIPLAEQDQAGALKPGSWKPVPWTLLWPWGITKHGPGSPRPASSPRVPASPSQSQHLLGPRDCPASSGTQEASHSRVKLSHKVDIQSHLWEPRVPPAAGRQLLQGYGLEGSRCMSFLDTSQAGAGTVRAHPVHLGALGCVLLCPGREAAK